MFGQPHPCIAIAGSGIAASALACLLRASGFGVILLARRRGNAVAPAAIEALPEATVRLLADAGLAEALAAADAVTVRGFDNASPPTVHRLDGLWTHVDRTRLATECLRIARHSGATVLHVDPLGLPVELPGEGVEVRNGEIRLRAAAAIDATGRAARWSRPVQRRGHACATLYSGPGSENARAGRMTPIRDGWAYRLDHPRASTIGVIRNHSAYLSVLDGAIAADLKVADPASFIRAGVRPAAAQWSQHPVTPQRLAIGDAAMAMSPISGQGLRFAVSSAFAAAHVLRSCRDNENASSQAADYYRSFVTGVRERHLTRLAAIEDTSPQRVPFGRHNREQLDPNKRLRWAVPITQVGMPVDGRIITDDCCVLPDGGLVRWLGGIDLLTLRAAVGDGPTPEGLCTRLMTAKIPHTSARILVAWAVQAGILRQVSLDN